MKYTDIDIRYLRTIQYKANFNHYNCQESVLCLPNECVPKYHNPNIERLTRIYDGCRDCKLSPLHSTR